MLTRSEMAGLFFGLASVEGAGLLFCPATIQPHTNVYSTFCRVNAIYRQRRKTAHIALQALFLRFATFHRHRYQTDTSGYNTACATLEHTTEPQHLQHIPKPAVTPDAVQLSTAAYYNKVYKGATDRKTYKPGGLQSGTGQRSGRTWSTWHPPPGGAVQRQSRSGRRGTIDGSRRISFRAFAR